MGYIIDCIIHILILFIYTDKEINIYNNQTFCVYTYINIYKIIKQSIKNILKNKIISAFKKKRNYETDFFMKIYVIRKKKQ